jgi:hypothetical protein
MLKVRTLYNQRRIGVGQASLLCMHSLACVRSLACMCSLACRGRVSLHECSATVLLHFHS